MAMVIALAAITGCRRGELCGLRRDDVDREHQTLRVERQWVAGAGGLQLRETTKTREHRTVSIGPSGVALPDRYRADITDRMGREPEWWLLSINGGTSPLRAKAVSD